MNRQHSSPPATRRKRPYLTSIVFAIVFIFLLYIAITSWNYQAPPPETPQPARQDMYLPIIMKGLCSSPPCPTAPAPTPYPEMQLDSLTPTP